MASRRRAPQPCATTDAGIIERPYANPLSRVPSASWERRFFRGICSLLSWPLLPDVENAMLVPSQGHEQAETGRATKEGRPTLIKRMDHVSVIVDDLEAAKAFFIELGMELEGESPIEGPWVDRVNGLEGVRVNIAMMRTPDGHGRLELTKFHSPKLVELEPAIAPPNTLGLRSIMFTVESVDDTVTRLRANGAELVGEVAQYEDMYRLCYMQGPAGIIVALAEELF